MKMLCQEEEGTTPTTLPLPASTGTLSLKTAIKKHENKGEGGKEKGTKILASSSQRAVKSHAYVI